MTPVIVIGGKIFGWFTPTEAACIAVLYAIALALFVYREMTGAGLHHALLDTGRFAAVTLFCVGTASAFGWPLAYYRIPKAILAGVLGWDLGPVGTGFFITLAFLVVGMFLDAIPAIMIVGTILEPLAKSVGIHPIHFAMIGICSLAFGLITPPCGLCLLISCSIANIRVTDALKGVMITILPMLAVLVVVIVWPEFSLFLPRLLVPDFLKRDPMWSGFFCEGKAARCYAAWRKDACITISSYGVVTRRAASRSRSCQSSSSVTSVCTFL